MYVVAFGQFTIEERHVLALRILGTGRDMGRFGNHVAGSELPRSARAFCSALPLRSQIGGEQMICVPWLSFIGLMMIAVSVGGAIENWRLSKRLLRERNQ